MENAETVLVPFDFSDASREALRIARDLASKFGARVVLAHIDALPVIASPEMAPMLVPATDMSEESRRALEEIAAKNGDVEIVTRLGDPAFEILSLVDELKPRLVCMGTHGRRGLARFVMGSVTEKVVRACMVPVLTVHAPATEQAA